MSDRTWNRLGRRRPYFLVGAILSSLALILMPNSPTLWVAAGLLWILDASINISMEPFRAFVADMLPDNQRTRGFAMQSVFIGLGAVIASALPYLLTNWFGMTETRAEGQVPASVRWSFYVGSVAFFGAVMWTVLKTREYPPDDLAEFRRVKAHRSGFVSNTGEIIASIRETPATMRQLAAVQFFTWLGLFCMWLYFAPAVARNVFGAPDENSPLYVTGVGIAWASTLSMPYAILAAAVPPRKTGIYMGIFNFPIVLPEIMAALVFGWVMAHLLDNNRLSAVVAGGAFMIVASALMLRVRENAAEDPDAMLVPVRIGGPRNRISSESVDLP